MHRGTVQKKQLGSVIEVAQELLVAGQSHAPLDPDSQFVLLGVGEKVLVVELVD